MDDQIIVRNITAFAAEVNSHLHALAVLVPEKEPSVPVLWGVMCVPEPIWAL